MAFLFLNIRLLMKQGLKITAEVAKIREVGKKKFAFDLGKGHFISKSWNTLYFINNT